MKGPVAVFRSGIGVAPPWCELESFDITRLRAGDTYSFDRVGRKERLFICRGDCSIRLRSGTTRAHEGMSVELESPNGNFEVVEVYGDTTLVRLCGRWLEPAGAYGVFDLDNSSSPHNTGDPTEYPRTTRFDNHYHDCDEYWIIVEGCGIAVSGHQVYVIGSGDCLATGKGIHHDFPHVLEPIKGVYFETTLEGKKRPGHLWNHTHGQAEPDQTRL